MAGINYVSKEHIALGAGFAGATMLCVYHPPPSKTHIKQSQKISSPPAPAGDPATPVGAALGSRYRSWSRLRGSAETQQLSRTCCQFGEPKPPPNTGDSSGGTRSQSPPKFPEPVSHRLGSGQGRGAAWHCQGMHFLPCVLFIFL